MAGTAVVLFSGGLDSATCLAAAARDGYAPIALTIDYGQRHRIEIERARAAAPALGAVEHVVMKVELSKAGGSALTDPAIPVPSDGPGPGIPATYVPARNLVLLACGVSLAEARGAEAVYAGMNDVDFSGYPDCRPEFVAAFQSAADLATRAGAEGRGVRLATPLMGMDKRSIIRLGLSLGVDYRLTHSCYDPGPAGRPCGHCDACRIRAAGFAAAGLADPALDPPAVAVR